MIDEKSEQLLSIVRKFTGSFSGVDRNPKILEIVGGFAYTFREELVKAGFVDKQSRFDKMNKIKR
jgi:hypothetical protein